jgi:uncharacterized membrane protein
MADKPPLTLSQKIADSVVAAIGSWRFIIIQSILLVAWIAANICLPIFLRWDPYPFILLNLFLSFQAAYTAPVIMMSNNRREEIDRRRNIAIYNLETEEHIILAKMLDHIDKHFENIHVHIDSIETKNAP